MFSDFSIFRKYINKCILFLILINAYIYRLRLMIWLTRLNRLMVTAHHILQVKCFKILNWYWDFLCLLLSSESYQESFLWSETSQYSFLPPKICFPNQFILQSHISLMYHAHNGCRLVLRFLHQFYLLAWRYFGSYVLHTAKDYDSWKKINEKIKYCTQHVTSVHQGVLRKCNTPLELFIKVSYWRDRKVNPSFGRKVNYNLPFPLTNIVFRECKVKHSCVHMFNIFTISHSKVTKNYPIKIKM